MEEAQYYAEKIKGLARLFEMGEYSVCTVDLELAQAEKDKEKTLASVREMLNKLDSIYTFSNAPLYSHMEFKSAEPAAVEAMRKMFLDNFASDEDFAYMRDDPRWNGLIAKL